MSLPGRFSAKGLAGITAAAIAGTAVVMGLAGATILTGTQRYSDIIVGEITFANAYKHGDLVASFMAVATFFVIWWLLVLLLAWRGALQQEDVGHPEPGHLWLLAVFSCYFAGLLLIRKDGGSVELWLSLCLLAAGVVLIRLYRGGTAERQIVFGLLAGVVIAGGMFFSTLALVVSAKFIFPQTLLRLISVNVPLVVGGLGLFAAMFLWKLPERVLVRIAHGAQQLVPLLILAGFCRVFQTGEGFTPNLVSLPVKGLALAVVGLLVAANLRQSFKARALEVFEPRDLLLRPAIMALAAFLAFTTPAYLERDFFHAGELFLTWHQIFEKGLFPFSGFAIARGFGDAVISLINVLFFDGNFATFTFAVPVYAMMISAVNALLFCCLIGNGWGAVLAVATAAAPYCNVSLFLPLFLLLAQPKLLAKPLGWLFAWLLISVAFCLYHTTNGIALMAGTLPVAAWVFSGAVKGGYLRDAWQSHRLRVVISSALLVLVLVLLSPLLVAWVTYVRDQGGVNELANGTVLLRELAIPAWFRWQNRWIFEGVRVGGWLIGCTLLWHLFVRERISQVKESLSGLPVTIEVLALSGIVSTVALIPYSMGRIDGKGLSRTGSVSMLVLCIMVPLVILLARKGRPKTVLCGAVFLIGIGASAYYESPAKMAGKALSAVMLPADAQLINGPAMGLPKVGTAFIDRETLSNLLLVKKVTDRFVRSGETYLDLTNHVGYYYLLDYPVPSLYAGYYIVTSETLQKKVIAALSKNLPPMVLAGPPRTFGSGTAALRSYRLYRWLLLQGYVPVYSDGLAVLVRPDRYREMSPLLPPLSEQVRLLSAIFVQEYIAGIPLAWGKNLDLLSHRFQKGGQSLRQISRLQQQYGSAGEGYVPVEIVEMAANEPIRGDEYDFLSLNLSGTGTVKQVKMSWCEAGKTYAEWNTLVFDVQSGVPLLVPLGSHPGWLLAHNITNLTFELIGSQGGGAFSMTPTFLKLIM